MDHLDYDEAVAAQPARLKQSAVSVRHALDTIDLSPWRQGNLAVVSMGASSHAAHALVHRLARHGRRVSNVDASELLALGRRDLADAYVFVSESGRSRETVEAARLVGGARLGLTNDANAPLGEVVDAIVDLGHGRDSRVYSVGYTATLQAFGLLATAIDGVREESDTLPELVARTLENSAQQARDLAEAWKDVTSIDFVGAGVARASAAEGALLIRESTRITATAYETYQYLHGPMESLTSTRACVLFGDDRELRLAGYLTEAGIPATVITTESRPNAITIPKTTGISQAVLEILPVQLLAGELAKLFGLDINDFLFTQADTKIAPD
ncbi:SIS domain-containing protein [Fodinicola acaciae]|uniref:SIS domain-containing protein n=1 Tax=Fodinicola acaciae TaxID=2681555 RepID=UPI0013D47696|nr:SIS domain-containing protein [Fodinicola acaciae]